MNARKDQYAELSREVSDLCEVSFGADGPLGRLAERLRKGDGSKASPQELRELAQACIVLARDAADCACMLNSTARTNERELAAKKLGGAL